MIKNEIKTWKGEVVRAGVLKKKQIDANSILFPGGTRISTRPRMIGGRDLFPKEDATLAGAGADESDAEPAEAKRAGPNTKTSMTGKRCTLMEQMDGKKDSKSGSVSGSLN